MAGMDKIKKRLGDDFPEKAVRAGEKLKTLIKENKSDIVSEIVPNDASDAMVEEGVSVAVERVIRDDVGTERMVLEAGSAGDLRRFTDFTAEAIVAIIESETRPPLLIVKDQIITDGSYQIDNDYERQDLLRGEFKARLEMRSLSVGAVDLIHADSRNYCGTGSLVAPNIVLTNRHVAEAFLVRERDLQWKLKHTLRGGMDLGPASPMLNFLRQQDTMGRREVVIEAPLYIARSGEPDMAFFRCQDVDLEPLQFDMSDIVQGLPIGVIGYPAWDGMRNSSSLMGQLFKHIYGVKRFSPGEVDAVVDTALIKHDCTTLGGNSGSPLINLETGEVVGLHYSGRYGEENRAVHARIAAAALRDIEPTRVVVSTQEAAVLKKPVRSRRSLQTRDGYDPNFLGTDSLRVPLPDLGLFAGDLSEISESFGGGRELKYHHFSVLQSSSRKLPRVTAVNIHGEKLGKVPARNRWHFDPRISLDDQAGNELYRDTSVANDLDRGHMVRRLDPCWGRKSDIKRAQQDTYHYTNCAPQHSGLNRRHWVGLEDYILDSARARNLKISVFTGPVFREGDPALISEASDVPIPREFWKVAVLVDADTGKLSASGYILSQGEMINGFTEAAFILGQYRTYQVPLSLIETHTGYDFGPARDADVMAAIQSNTEALFGAVFKLVTGPSDIRVVAEG